ncbi:MAG: EMC3/TMCO1 family protein [Candidatus Pacearchaeota archaeon]
MEEMEKKGEGSFTPIIIVMILSLVIAFFWDKLEFIRNSVNAVLSPTAGFLLNWNLTAGMFIIVILLSLIITVIQKYATDQKTLKEMKDQQKKLNEEAKKVRDNPEKMMEIQKESMKFMVPMMKLSMRALVFTGIPFILFFRWFNDFFIAVGDPRFFGFMSWLFFYIVFSIVFSSIFRKILKVV